MLDSEDVENINKRPSEVLTNKQLGKNGSLSIIPTKLTSDNRPIESVTLSGELDVPEFSTVFSNRNINAKIGQKNYKIGTGKSVRITGETERVKVFTMEFESELVDAEIPRWKRAKRSTGHYEEVTVIPEIFIRNHGELQIKTV